MDEQFIFFNRKSQTPEDIYGRNPLDQDTTRYFPWVYDTPGGELGWQWWAVHLLEDWAELPQYLATPPKYDEAYYQLKGEQRTAWLAALRRVCNGLFEGAILPDIDAEDDYYPLAVKLREDYGGLKENLANAIKCGLQKLEDWLSWREQSAITQLLTALSVVHLIAQEGAIIFSHNDQRIEAKRFKVLLEEFQHCLVAEPPVESWLRISHSQFLALSELTLPTAPVSVGELSSVFSSLQWPNLSEVLNLPMSPNFWPELIDTLTIRVEWANKAATLVGNALGLSALSTQKLDASKATLSLKQGAILCYYTKQPITDNNKSELAARFGYTGKTSGRSLMEEYGKWCELLDSELSASKRQLDYLKKDLAEVLPHLNDKAANEVVKLLNRIAKKYKGGLKPPSAY